MVTDADAAGFARKLSEAANRVARDYAKGDSVHEDPTSGQLTGRLKETLQDFETENIRWQVDVVDDSKGRGRLTARQLTSKVKGSEESAIGADIVFCLDIETDRTSIRKGFLVQAKRLEPDESLSLDVAVELRRQCRQMLAVTSDSMVFLYSTAGIHVVPATAVVAAQHDEIYSLPTWPLETLFYDFAICWYGDPTIEATDPISLEGVRRLAAARAAVLIQGRESKPFDIRHPDPGRQK